MKIHFPPLQEKQVSGEKDFENFLNFLPDAVVAVKPDGRIILVNNQTEKIFGYGREELLGQTLEILLPESYRLIHGIHRSTYFKYPRVRGMGTGLELFGRKKDGSEFPVEISLSPFETDDGAIAISTIRDISDRKRAEEKQRKAQQKIEELLNFTPDAIVVINKKGEIVFVNNQSEKLFEYRKQELIGSTLGILLPQRFRNIHNEHQLDYFQSPVANIIGTSSMLQMPELDDDERQIMIRGLHSSIKQLDEIIRDLNNILQVRNEISEKKEKVFLPELLNEVKDDLVNLIKRENARITSSFDEVSEIFTLKSYLYGIFYNLISNSIKYGRPGITPLIDIKTKNENSKIILYFSDNGMGIDLSKQKNQLFGLYKKFHPQAEGKGMGLFMTKIQTEVLGGRIRIESEVNKGTEVIIEFDSY
ncbi:MAG TPA: PAS domain S-box protein [Ignavibacteriaceae bacterium]|nr:PAS domain S-box protein [Ignavibacteriaceae bacterium]